jgi:coatomer subunit beta
VEAPLASITGAAVPNLRALLLGGDFFLGGVIAGTLTKLLLRWRALKGDGAQANKLSAHAMLTIVSILRLGESPALPMPLDDDSRDRMKTCLQVLAAPHPDVSKVRGGVIRPCGGCFACLVTLLCM